MEQSHASRSRSSRRPSGVRLTERDRLLLDLAAEHRLILAAHVSALLQVSGSAATRRLGRLCEGGYLRAQRVLAGQPTWYQISSRGLEAAQSTLPRPRLDLRSYGHDVGLVWLWLAARAGTFGPMQEVLSERTLRSRDALAESRRSAGARPTEQPLGVRLGGWGPGGRERLHYPDLLLITPEGRRVGVELELSSKGRARRDRILAGYGSDPRFDAVLYLVDQPGLARSIRASARRLGISALVHVQWARRSGPDQRPEDLTAQRPSISRGGTRTDPTLRLP